MFKSKGVMFLTLVIMLMSWYCSGPDSDLPVLKVEFPLHLEEHIIDAKIVGSEVPEDLPVPVVWNFDEPQPNWKPTRPIQPQMEAVKPVRIEDALRLPLTIRNRRDVRPRLLGSIYIELPDWDLEQWAYVEVRARTQDAIRVVGLDFNYTENDPIGPVFPFYTYGDRAPLVTDGTVQTYRLSLDWPGMRRWEGPWTHLGIWFNSQDNEEAVALDLLSVRVIPREAEYAKAAIGVQEIPVGNRIRRALYTHVPGRLEYKVRVPERGRFDVGLGVLREDVPVTFRIEVQPRGGEPATMLEESYSKRDAWGQRSIDLAEFVGRNVTLALETDAAEAGKVAFWGAPTVSGSTRVAEKPNVIFYVIDGAAADLMSVYGYNRRTTPNLERIASEGAVFEHAYSNASWTQPSTLSFMTSLQYSVASLSQDEGWPQAPDQALTMAQHVHRAGYQTAVLVSNAYAGRASGLDRGVDKMRDIDPENYSISSVLMHNDFWKWREEYPAEPYWVHFQTTDIHTPWHPVAPFAGLYVSPSERKAFIKEFAKVGRMPVPEDFERTGIDRVAHFHTARGIYDEAMAHQDYQIGRLVERLKTQGEWKHTLFIVAADHSHFHAGLSLLDPLPPELDEDATAFAPIISSWISHIPMIIVWPERIAAGMRFSDPVSMIDMLPTILDLLDLPMPEVMQGQSLAPLLLGETGWRPKPVILDEIRLNRATREPEGRIEVIDGRWGASLYVHPNPKGDYEYRRLIPLLVYDLWNDPYCLDSLHEDRPDLAEKYNKFLKEQLEAHQSLAKLFSRSGKEPLTPKQLENLRSLGYIR